jgi:predicted outer membrane protein
MLSGKSFDDAYVKMMVDDHKEDVAAFEKLPVARVTRMSKSLGQIPCPR